MRNASSLLVEHIKMLVKRANENALAHDHRRAIDLVIGQEVPARLAGLAVDAPDLFVAAPDHDEIFGDGRGAEEALLALWRLEGPLDFERLQVDRNDLVRHGADVQVI